MWVGPFGGIWTRLGSLNNDTDLGSGTWIGVASPTWVGPRGGIWVYVGFVNKENKDPHKIKVRKRERERERGSLFAGCLS